MKKENLGAIRVQCQWNLVGTPPVCRARTVTQLIDKCISLSLKAFGRRTAVSDRERQTWASDSPPAPEIETAAADRNGTHPSKRPKKLNPAAASNEGDCEIHLHSLQRRGSGPLEDRVLTFRRAGRRRAMGASLPSLSLRVRGLSCRY